MNGQPTGKVYEEGALFGSLRGAAPPWGVAHGQWWRIITSGFLHENLIHIGFNMYVLYLLGMMLEPAIGHREVRDHLRGVAADRLLWGAARHAALTHGWRFGRHVRV